MLGTNAAQTANSMTRTIAIGNDAGKGKATSTSTDDIFIGYKAGYSNTTGSENVFLGNTAGLNNTEGTRNIFIGDSSGVHITSGSTNIYVGSGAGYGRKISYGNICLGVNAGHIPYTPKTLGMLGISNNIYIGHNCGGFTGGSNVIIGNYRNIDENNPRIIGGRVLMGVINSYPTLTLERIRDSANVGRTFAVINNGDALLMGSFKTKRLTTGGDLMVLGDILPGKKVDFGGVNDAARSLGNSSRKWDYVYAVEVRGTRIYANNTQLTSDKRLKTDIRPLENALARLMKLNGVTYKWRTDEFKERGFDTKQHAGVLAQEVEAVLPEAVVTGEDGYKSVSYNDLVPLLIEAVKEQQKQIDELKKLVEQLMKK